MTERTIVQEVRVSGPKIIHADLALITEEDGVETSRQTITKAYSPGDDLTDAPQEVQDLAAEAWTPDVVAEYRQAVAAPSMFGGTSREAMLSAASARIDQEHAIFMRRLTGDATIEERDTWKTKEEAARAYLADGASDGQSAMIELEATGTGEEPSALAARIIAKADAFMQLIALASKLRAEARAAVQAATADTVPIQDVPAALEDVFDALSAQVAGAIALWQSGGS